jgi:hypothetical protein
MDAPYVPIEFEIIYLVRGYKCSDKEDKETLEKEITNKAIDTFYSTDTTYFAICAEEDMRDGHDSIELKKELSKHANDKCILGFTGVFHNHPTLIYDKTNCKLPVDYKLYLLKYGDTFLLPKEYKTEWTVLPKTKRHGYSCGVAISDKNDSFIFWTVAW